ncbi:MAG: DUF917 domain-containing protein [Sodalis sp. (in: enterobacteria)]|uniref:DUF917 domain-containing protein n=1 Tax=Sodalis sp. (in: enterobacteria) TaxID=1898979 RepID=UPI0039E5A11B
MKWLDHEAIDYISYGAAILANGGGGDPYIGKIMAQRAIVEYGPIRLLTLDELQPEELLLATGMIGSPAVMMEKLPNGQESLTACRIIAQHMGRSLSAIYPIETGGINSLLPLASACILGLPVMDVDAIGREVQQARAARRNVIDTLTALLHGVVLFRGKANRVNQRSEGGFNHCTACFVGVDNDSGGRFDVLFQNEYLLARRDDRPLCMTPDLIILLDEETGLPILGERLCYGMRVVALGVPAHEKWRTSRGIEVCGPRYFHYQNDYTPVETLAARCKEESA